MGQPIRPATPANSANADQPRKTQARITSAMPYVPEGGPVPETPIATLRLVSDSTTVEPKPGTLETPTETHTGTPDTGPDDSSILYKFERRTSPRELIIGEAIAAFVTGDAIDHAVVAPAQLIDLSASAGGTGIAGLGVRTSVRIPVGSEFSLFPSDQLPRQTGMVVRCEEDPELPGNFRLGLRCRPRLNAA
jgi:hypothetical protein